MEVPFRLYGSEMLLQAFRLIAGEEPDPGDEEPDDDDDDEDREVDMCVELPVSSKLSTYISASSSSPDLSLLCPVHFALSSTARRGMVNCGMLFGVTTLLRMLSLLVTLSQPRELECVDHMSALIPTRLCLRAL